MCCGVACTLGALRASINTQSYIAAFTSFSIGLTKGDPLTACCRQKFESLTLRSAPSTVKCIQMVGLSWNHLRLDDVIIQQSLDIISSWVWDSIRQNNPPPKKKLDVGNLDFCHWIRIESNHLSFQQEGSSVLVGKSSKPQDPKIPTNSHSRTYHAKWKALAPWLSTRSSWSAGPPFSPLGF